MFIRDWQSVDNNVLTPNKDGDTYKLSNYNK